MYKIENIGEIIDKNLTVLKYSANRINVKWNIRRFPEMYQEIKKISKIENSEEDKWENRSFFWVIEHFKKEASMNNQNIIRVFDIQFISFFQLWNKDVKSQN
jgi:hypothetical protein